VRWRALAPGKVNLCLFLGPPREDGRHELVTVFESVSLADEVVVSGGASSDQVVCPDVEGPNIVRRAVDGLRARGWDAPWLRVEIRKRVPVAAGMGGGSADAAAMLRIAARISPVGDDAIAGLAAELGADVPSQLRPGVWLGRGAGERLEPTDPVDPHAFVIVPQRFPLSTEDVYAAADRLGLPRSLDELRGVGLDVGVNDLQAAALSLRPSIAEALEAVRGAGADVAFVCGSGPTVAGLYWGQEAQGRASAAAGALAGRFPGAVAVVPVTEDFGAPAPG
jgi:4-diphosphocytidyl-2-C-methyl-D-erythritol kinase